MEPLLFQIVFEGKLKDGIDPAKASEKLGRTFRLNPDTIQRLLSGRPVVIKRGLTPELAEKYKAALAGIGYDARIEREPASDMPAAEARDTKPDAGAGVSACPKCGHRPQDGPSSPASDECPKCGVIISKYAAARQTEEPPRPGLTGTVSDSPATHACEGQEIDFPQPGLMRLICALEFTLPETLSLPADEGPWEQASLKTRFFAALASFSAWIYCTFLFANLVGLLMLPFLMMGILPRFSHNDVHDIMGIVGVFLAAPYLFAYLPLRWNGLTYGQRLMGIWVAPRDWRDQPIGPGAVLLRFAGTALNLASWGGLNLIWPFFAGGKNLADTFASTVQFQAQPDRMPANPALAALKPIAYAIAFILALNLTAKPVIWYLSNNKTATPRALQQSVSQAGNAVSCYRQKVREIQDRQAALMAEMAEGKPGSHAGPRARDSAPAGSRSLGPGMSPPEVLSKLATMQKEYYAAHNRYSQDLNELLQLYGRGSFLNLNSISAMVRSNDLKVEITATGFEIRMKFQDVWQTITERGNLDVRPQ